jgi:acetylornithine deacetylase
MRESLALADPASPVWAAVDAAIGDGAEAAFSFLERLVASPSTVGRELPAQQIVAAELGHPLVDALAAAHQRVHGVPPRRVVTGSTTDARYYLNQFGVPAVAYGPRSRNIHGTDEAVELASITSGARALARFMAGFFAEGVRR